MLSSTNACSVRLVMSVTRCCRLGSAPARAGVPSAAAGGGGDMARGPPAPAAGSLPAPPAFVVAGGEHLVVFGLLEAFVGEAFHHRGLVLVVLVGHLVAGIAERLA